MDKLEKMIGANIRSVRQEKNLSQEALAELCGFANTTLSAYENSKKVPKLRTVALIAKKLGVPIERLYYGDDSNSFIVSEPDEGKKIVNAIYFLWEIGVIYYYETPMPANMIYSRSSSGEEISRGMYLLLVKYCMPLRRLINSLNEFKSNRETYSDPDKYLEILMTSVATEINNEIASEKIEKEKKLQEEKQKARNLLSSHEKK